MSDEMYDDPDFQNMMQEEMKTMTPEDVFSMVMFNSKKLVRVSIELRDAEGNVIELAEVIEDLLGYIERKLDDDKGNQFADQIYPLMSKMLASGLGRLIGIYQTGFYLANAESRYAFINMMSLAFLLLKYTQQKGLTIHTSEEKVTQEDIDEVQRKSQEHSEMVLSTMAANSTKQIIRNLVNQGKISADEIRELLDDEPKGN